jgi:AcrR family transcriptional regulator
VWEGDPVSSTPVAAPPRGTRPPNRRELLRAAATELFVHHGYANVAISDIAAAVNVGPSAVYRHYPGKADLLFDALDDALGRTMAGLPAPGTATLAGIARGIAVQTLDNRPFGVLLQRELRQLSPEATVQIRRKRAEISRWLTAELAAQRPELSAEQAELLGICAMDAVTSISFHHIELPRARYEELLTGLALRVLLFDPPADVTVEGRPRRVKTPGRADEILEKAMALFAERGYAEVGIDDIGAAVGIAGPSLYHHFPSKQSILVEAMQRGLRQLLAALHNARAQGTDPADVLRRLTNAYVDLTLDHPDLISVLVSETVHLRGTSDAPEMRGVQHAYIADWVDVALAVRPAADPTEVRVTVQAAQMMANDVTRTPRLRRIPGLRATVRAVALALQQ